MGTPIGQGAFSLLRAFLRDNPDEELTYEQAMTKFGISQRDLSFALWMLKVRDEVEVVRVIRPKKVDAT